MPTYPDRLRRRGPSPWPRVIIVVIILVFVLVMTVLGNTPEVAAGIAGAALTAATSAIGGSEGGELPDGQA